MIRRIAFSVACVLPAFLVLTPGLAQGSITTFTFSSSSGSLSASATFELLVGNKLQLTLTNTSSYDVLEPIQVLTAVFFNLTPPTSLTPVSALVAPGSTVLFETTASGGIVGGEWAFKSGLTGAPGNTALGVSSSGLGLFGPDNVFPPGTNLQGPDDPDGLQYGITSAGDNPTTGNQKVTGGNDNTPTALIKNSVIFTFNAPDGFSPETNISDVQFQYGTSLSETCYPGNPSEPHSESAPEPGSIVVWSLLFGAVCVGLRIRRRRV
jgi:hypothetical protein